jgi:hypothetical protein
VEKGGREYANHVHVMTDKPLHPATMRVSKPNGPNQTLLFLIRRQGSARWSFTLRIPLFGNQSDDEAQQRPVHELLGTVQERLAKLPRYAAQEMGGVRSTCRQSSSRKDCRVVES